MDKLTKWDDMSKEDIASVLLERLHCYRDSMHDALNYNDKAASDYFASQYTCLDEVCAELGLIEED